MKLNRTLVPLVFLALCLSSVHVFSQLSRPVRTGLETQLSALPEVTEVMRLESAHFEEKYKVCVRQRVNHQNITYGFFEQRVFVMHKGYDRPTVLVTEGYGADYAAHPRYREELSGLLDANLIVVEHRYFGESIPSPRRWEWLNGPAAMEDLHLIRERLGTIYTGKWIATGISKGGQTAIMYRTFYPDDVDITVCYVAPLCLSARDKRHAQFIANKVGTPDLRKKVFDFQKEVLNRRDSLMPLFVSFCDSAGLAFTRPVSEIFDYCVLEYSFAFWQWGTDPQSIPDLKADDRQIFTHFVQIATPDYFVRDTPTMPFFIQAAKELGYYTYDTSRFKFKVSRTRFVPEKEKKGLFGKKKKKQAEAAAEAAATAVDAATAEDLAATAEVAVEEVAKGEWVTKKYPAMELRSSNQYLKELFLPDFYKPPFRRSLSKLQRNFLKQTEARMVFIYGEWDPWTAAAVPNPEKPNILYYVQPRGSHRARISTLPEPMRESLVEQLQHWLNN
ncbi:MAG: aminopeptidase [Bacteroidales bacterium]|nr:aminopeptidase [Bacteroidales bacterium]